MTSSLELSDILEKVKLTTFKDDESVLSDGAHMKITSWNQRILSANNSLTVSRSTSSDKSQATISSVSRNRSSDHERQSSVSARSTSTVHSSQDLPLEYRDSAGTFQTIHNEYLIDVDRATEPSPPKTMGSSTRYESSRSSSSSRHSSAQWSNPREDQVYSVDNLFDRLIDMSRIPENANRILNSEGLDTLVATMYPESCHGCGTMSLSHVFHLTKRARKSQSMKAISDVYKNLGEAGRRHYKVHRHASFLIKCMECLMDVYVNIRTTPGSDSTLPNTQPLQTLIVLTKMSFDEDYRTVMNDLGVIFAVAEFISLCALFQPIAFSFTENDAQISLSEAVKYGCTILTNLTCGDHHVKSALSQLTPLLEVLLAVLRSKEGEDVMRVVISLFRNLSWRASSQTKHNLSQVGACAVLVSVGMRCSDTSTVKVLTSSLWNLSAHNNANKEALCNVGLELLGNLINQPIQRNTAILENTLGILRNISSHIAQESRHRRTIRDSGIIPRLVDFLKCTNDTIISTSTGALWNLSARSPTDQLFLRECGAVPILRSLSLHLDGNIAKSASGALRNIMSGGSHSRSISPESRDDPRDAEHVMQPPAQFWFDDYSLISSSDSRSRHSASPKQVRRKIEGRHSTKQKLRFSPTVDKFNC